jgi:8-oxo-dGTP pyrophosphatase MutT (NUDIX family)
MEQMRTKQSYGLACCKFINGILHILMVKKKYTYAFFEFVFCKYPRFDRARLEKLFDNMTYQEKTDILEMDFDKLWRKIVINIPDDPKLLSKKIKIKRPLGKKNIELQEEEEKQDISLKERDYGIYLTKKQRFLNLIEDNGRRLRELVHHSKSADPIWDIPKGRPENDEKPLDTAIREFSEEASGNIEQYKILIDIQPIKVNYVNADCLYRNEYFIAVANDNWIPQCQYNCYENNREVEEIRWISRDEVKFLNRGQHNHERIMNLFKSVNNLIKPYKKNFNVLTIS